MSRQLAAGSSVLVAYFICALSGVNQWDHVWLKSFYPAYAVVLWVTLSSIVLLISRTNANPRRGLLFFGAAAGYLAGIVAYNLGPAIRDGSFMRILSTIEADGVLSYIALSAVYPLLLLSPVTGVIAVAVFAMLSRSTKEDRYFAIVIVSVVIISGWTFFLTRGGLPLRW